MVVVSNQPDVAKGKITLELLEKIDKKMERELKKKGAHLDAIYCCLRHLEKGFSGEVPELKIY